MRRTILVGLAALALSACESNPWVIEAEAAVAPPNLYYQWFDQVARCMRRPEHATRARFDLIRWRTGVEIEHPTKGQAWGLWTEPHQITVRSDKSEVELVVKHELVHDLLQDPEHPPPHFERCAGR